MNEKLVLRISGVVSFLSGIVILFTTIYPIVSYENRAAVKYPMLLSPLSDKKTYGAGTTNNSSTSVDYTNPQNWFVGADYKNDKKPKVAFYTITIPKLSIEDATVEIGGEDLGKSLIQYPGTALPGKPGNAVIFGHSILPQFYNPKSYLSIFSLLSTLDKGDEVEIKYDGVTYKFEVETMFEILPTDLQVLDQQEDSAYVTLVTCTPPGHPLKPRRLIVRAKIKAVNKGLTPKQ